MNSRMSYAAGVRRRRFVFVLVLVGSLATAGVAFAGTIADPGSSPFQVFGDAAGHPQSFTIVAQDFGEADAVSVEQCDGTDPTSPSWSVTAHCDQGTATGIVLADVNGTATFPADDPSVGLLPVQGREPVGPVQLPLAEPGIPEQRPARLQELPDPRARRASRRSRPTRRSPR